MRRFATVVAALCVMGMAPAAHAQLRHSDTPPPAGGPINAIKALADKAADRMADQCRPDFCMDANEYGIGCTQIRDLVYRFVPCGYELYGYIYVGDEPVGDFDCRRSARVGFRRHGNGITARSTGKTACRDDRANHATYPWPDPNTECHDVIVLPGPYTIAQCIAPLPKPHKTLRRPLKARPSSAAPPILN